MCLLEVATLQFTQEVVICNRGYTVHKRLLCFSRESVIELRIGHYNAFKTACFVVGSLRLRLTQNLWSPLRKRFCHLTTVRMREGCQMMTGSLGWSGRGYHKNWQSMTFKHIPGHSAAALQTSNKPRPPAHSCHRPPSYRQALCPLLLPP